MDRTVFDGLEVVLRAYACDAGRSEVCRTADGALCIRLHIVRSACQRDCLSGGARAAARLDRGALEVLLPFREGMPLGRFLSQAPGLGARRAVCLDLVAQCVEAGAAPCVIALSAREENLCLAGGRGWLQLLPDWSGWRPDLGPACHVSAVAALCRPLLTRGFSPLQARLFPPELRLFLARLENGSYQSWGQLQRDLAAIPDRLAPPFSPQRARMRRAAEWARRYAKPAARAAVALLLAAAALSLWGAYLSWRSAGQTPWPGITSIGGQDLTAE